MEIRVLSLKEGVPLLFSFLCQKKVYLFDMDGVIVDTENYYYQRRLNFLTSKGITIKEKDENQFIGLTSKQIWHKLMEGTKYDPIATKHEYDQYRHHYPTNFKKLLNQEIYEIMKSLKECDKVVAIVSSSPTEVIEDMIKQCNLQDTVDFYISGETCKESKPNPEVYLKAIIQSQYDPSECIAIEDSKVGIEAANRAGIDVIEYQIKRKIKHH